MSHPILGPDAVRRDVFVAPSRLARETELVDAVYAMLRPWLDHLANDAEDVGAEAERAVAAVRVIAEGGSADADTAHDRLVLLARDYEDSGDHDCMGTARIAWLAAAWLSIRTGRRLRAETAGDDPLWRFGGLLNVLALPRLDEDFRELFGELGRVLTERDDLGALDALYPAMKPLLELVGTEPALAGELERFAAGADIDVTSAHDRLVSLAASAAAKADVDSHRLSAAARSVAVWLRMRSRNGIGHLAGTDEHHPPATLRWLAEQIVWIRAGARADDFGTVSWHPEHCDRWAAIREVKAVYRLVTGSGIHDAHRPGTSGADYEAVIDAVVERLSELSEARRLEVLFGWISPLLDQVAWENRDFLDDPGMETAEAVERFRRIAAGEVDDVDAVHRHLESFALTGSEDQDPDMHVRAQAASLACDWLCRGFRRVPRFDREPPGDRGPDRLSETVNTLAWTRSRQLVLLPEYVDEFGAQGHRDVLSPMVELRAMLDDLA